MGSNDDSSLISCRKVFLLTSLSKILFERLTCPHVVLREMFRSGSILIILLDRVVRQMNLSVKVVQSELLAAEAKVAVFVKPKYERIPIGDQKPLADVELGAVHQQRAF